MMGLSTGWDVLDTALAALAGITAGIDSGHWGLATPCDQWNVIQVLQHAAGDQHAWAAAVSGGEWPAENPFTPSGRLSGSPGEVVDQAVYAAAGAWAMVPADAAAVTTPLPTGPMPASLAATACALDAGVHAWDLAVAIELPSPLTKALAAELHAAATQFVEPLRAYVYAPVVAPDSGDDEVAILLKYLGRRPDWKAS
jgi:uncharacterized protein (TIGR03086 family)